MNSTSLDLPLSRTTGKTPRFLQIVNSLRHHIFDGGLAQQPDRRPGAPDFRLRYRRRR